MIARVACVAVALVACGRKPAPPTISAPVRPQIATAADRILPLLPEGAQVIVELDLARLRRNPVVGALVTELLAVPDGAEPARWPAAVPGAPVGTEAALARASIVVLAAYGVGTGQAATITVLSAAEDVPGAARLGDGLYALGPASWVAQVEARAAIAGIGAATGARSTAPPLLASAELLALRDRAMPPKAPGASLRITARLPFDARVALARQTGLDSAPAQLSLWADVVDDLAIVIDADAADPGDRSPRQATRRLEAGVRGALDGLARTPSLRALGIATSLSRARLSARGTWVRTIVAIGPDHLRRVVERAAGYLAPPAPPVDSPQGAS